MAEGKIRFIQSTRGRTITWTACDWPNGPCPWVFIALPQGPFNGHVTSGARRPAGHLFRHVPRQRRSKLLYSTCAPSTRTAEPISRTFKSRSHTTASASSPRSFRATLTVGFRDSGPHPATEQGTTASTLTQQPPATLSRIAFDTQYFPQRHAAGSMKSSRNRKTRTLARSELPDCNTLAFYTHSGGMPMTIRLAALAVRCVGTSCRRRVPRKTGLLCPSTPASAIRRPRWTRTAFLSGSRDHWSP